MVLWPTDSAIRASVGRPSASNSRNEYGAIVGGYLFALPWLLPLLGILNLPFMVSAFRAFRMDTATRRNHALEHATIIYLEERSGRRFRGRASSKGFRISGRTSPKEIKEAFDQVRGVIRNGKQLSYFAYGDFVTFVTQSEQERDAVLKYWTEESF